MDRGRPFQLWMRPASILLAVATALATLLVFPGASLADVTATQGLAYNYRTDVSLFGGPSAVRGHGQGGDAPATAASPSVQCPEGGGSDSATKPDGASAEYGPATLFGGIWPEEDSVAPPSGPLTSEIECVLGADGFVTASTSVTLTPDGADYPGGVGPGPLVADEAHSSCTASEDGFTSDVQFVNGVVETQSDPDTGVATQTEPIPVNPPAGLQISGTLDHVGDSFVITFNQQIENADGSVTVNAAHMELLGPTAVGELTLGSVTCGVTATTTPPPPPGGVCPAEPTPATFTDREDIPATHRANVDCAVMLDVIRGFQDNTYQPRTQVRRDQMASFIARSLETAGVTLPPPAQERFTDVAPGSTHDDAIHRLAAAGIVQGGAGGGPADSYGPALRVRRDQMASFLIRAAELALGQPLASETQAFADVPPNNPHFLNVNGAAAVGLAQGTGDNTYQPGAVVRRDQMASFIVRLLNEVSDDE